MKKFVLLMLAALLLLSACSLRENTPDTSAPDASSTAPTDTAEPSDTHAPAALLGVREVPLADGDVFVSVFVWDESRVLFSVREPETDEAGNLIPDGSGFKIKRSTLRLFDNKSGTFVAECAWPEAAGPDRFLYGDAADSVTVYNNGGNAYTLRYADGALTLQETAMPAAVLEGTAVLGVRRVFSPDGKTIVYKNADAYNVGAVTVVRENGSSEEILRDVSFITEGVGGATGYSPVAFLDDSRLVYSISGWENALGYGIYDLASGEMSEFRNGMSVCGVYGGAIYLTQSESSYTTTLYRDDLGVMTMLADVSPESPEKRAGYVFVEGKWIELDYSANVVNVYAADMSRPLLEGVTLPERLYHITITDADGLVLVD